MIIPAGMLIEGEGHLDWKPHQVRLGATLQGGGDILLVICDNGRPDLRQGLVLCQALARLISPYSSYIGGMVSTAGKTRNGLLRSRNSSVLTWLRWEGGGEGKKGVVRFVFGWGRYI